MTTRIRYIKAKSLEGQDVLVSKQHFNIDGADFRVYLIEDECKFLITDTLGVVIKRGGNTKNKNVLKIQAKKALEELGYVFQPETR